MENINFDEIIQLVKDSFLSEKANGMNSVIQIEIQGIDEKDWNIQIENGKCVINRGKNLDAKLSICISKEDLFKLFRKELNPGLAYFSGKIKINGNPAEIIKLVNLFDVDIARVDQLLSKYQ
jgi:putative sterol carrier protein